ISKGDIPEKITDAYKGDFNEIKNNINMLIDALNGLINEATTMEKAAAAGELDTRADVSQYNGAWANIVQGLNNTLEGVVVPINEAMQVLGRMADRDLTKQVVGDFKGKLADFKENINEAVKSMHEALGQVAIAAEQVGSASEQVASSSQQLAEGASEQASSLEETSSSLEQMASMTKQNADNANQANTLMKDANQVVEKANVSMQDLTTSMEDISKASEETSKIIKTIDEIAFQTNLLALNAAVEAARAGEAGAGFAVVAEEVEVRNLAMRSADAAKNTSVMIEGTVKKVGGGAELVAKTNEAFTEVATAVSKVGELVGEIAAASQEQSQGIEQVNKAVAEMDKVTQANAANAEESASASEEMSAQAQELNGMIAEFKLNQSGRKQIAKAGPRQQVKKIDHTKKPEAVIPMEDDKKTRDDDFRDF
ncbi:MAG: chemotaxis protein, partial [Euryarchaeota archaeon]|nr:chemotaxis protein [Euryarchaeota archaeon]